MVSWQRALSIGLIVGLTGVGEVAHAQTEIKVTNLLGEQALTDPLPVQVELRQRGASTRGTLEWWSESSLRYRLSVELPAGARKVVHLALPLNAWSQPSRRSRGQSFSVPVLVWRSDAGEFRMFDVPFTWSNRLPIVVVGDVQGGFERWRQATFALEYRFNTQEVRSGDWSLEPIYWSPASVPQNWKALLGIPLIILTEGGERLTTEQWDALLAWLLAGGHLIVSVGSIGAPLKGTPLAPLLPPLGERKLIPPLPPRSALSQGSWRGGASDSPLPLGEGLGVRAKPEGIPLLQSPGWSDGFAPMYIGSALVACSRRVGRGTLTLCLGDMTAPAWRDWQGYGTLINQWAGMMNLPLFRIRTPFETRSLRPPLEPKHVMGATAIFALYWLALYLSWRIMRRQRQLIRAPLVLTVLTGLAWLALVRLAPPSVYQAQSHRARILLADSRLPLALEHSRYHLLFPAGEHRLRWEQGVQTLAMRRRTLLSERITVEYGAHTEILFQPFGAAEVQLQMVRPIKLPAPLRVSLQSGRYIVRNSLPYPLSEVQIRRAYARGVEAGVFEIASSLPSGATVSAKPKKVPSPYGFLPDEGEWLATTISDMPAPLKTPLNGHEEPTTLWVRIR